MKRSGLLVVSICLCLINAVGQTSGMPTKGPGFYFNGFQSYYNKNVDSSLYCLRQLATKGEYIHDLQFLVHDGIFFQSFLEMWDNEVRDSLETVELNNNTVKAYAILKRMLSDSNINLVNSARPIDYLAKIQSNKQNIKILTKLTNEFIQTELLKDMYDNRAGRYALLIYQVISKEKELAKLSETLLTATIEKLRSNLSTTDQWLRPMAEKRISYKFLYACANFFKAEELVKQKQETVAGTYYKIAAAYSPGLADNQYQHAYFYDMAFLVGEEKKTFQDDYLSYLMKGSKDNKEALRTMTSMALTDPVYKEKLKHFYDSTFSGNEPFDAVWLKEINKSAEPMVDFSLRKLDGTVFSTAAVKGKWLLLDFWGTWCGPCREEHPNLEKFYQSDVAKVPANIVLLTVACRDNEGPVKQYMKEHNYSFPVAMADNKIENLCGVKSYPTKLLVTPQGRYVLVPFGMDWVEFIKQYAGL